MTNQERLEKCKVFANANDIDWLISTVEEQQKEIEHLEQGHVGMLEAHGKLNREVENLFMAYEGQKKVNNRLREALRFYADVLNYYPQGDNVVSKITEDYGSKALEVLHG